MNKNVRTLVNLAMFLAIGIVLSYFESYLPLPIPVPGIRLGLANVIGIVVLCLYSPKEYVGITLLRVLIVGLIRGSMINLAISMGGCVLSIIATLLVYYFSKSSVYGISIASSIMHALGQVLVVMIIYSLPQMINYLFIILFASIVSSVIIAALASLIISRLGKVIIKNN